MSCLLSHSINGGTSSAARGMLGLDMIPTVLMGRMQEEFAVAFGSLDGAFNQVCPESECGDCIPHFSASRFVQLRVPHNAPFAHIISPDFKLRLHQDHHLALL